VLQVIFKKGEISENSISGQGKAKIFTIEGAWFLVLCPFAATLCVEFLLPPISFPDSFRGAFSPHSGLFKVSTGADTEEFTFPLRRLLYA